MKRWACLRITSGTFLSTATAFMSRVVRRGTIVKAIPTGVRGLRTRLAMTP